LCCPESERAVDLRAVGDAVPLQQRLENRARLLVDVDVQLPFVPRGVGGPLLLLVGCHVGHAITTCPFLSTPIFVGWSRSSTSARRARRAPPSRSPPAAVPRSRSPFTPPRAW